MQHLTNQFLIAMPALNDPNFEKTVTLVCQHDAEGALGIVINRPSDLLIGDVFAQLKLPTTHTSVDRYVLNGGPVHNERGLILHSGDTQYESTITVTDTLRLTTSMDVLEAIASNQGPERFLIALGYASWAPEQLEDELQENVWLSGPATEDVIFNSPMEQRWMMAAASFGIDMRLMSHQAGHA